MPQEVSLSAANELGSWVTYDLCRNDVNCYNCYADVANEAYNAGEQQ